MPFLVDWLNSRVLPQVDPGACGGALRWGKSDAGSEDGTPCLRVELHDSYSYLPRSAQYTNALTFARPQDARGRNAHMALLPDPYLVSGMGGLLDLKDKTRWEDKSPTMFFAGSSTGDRDPSRNLRLRAVVWGLDHKDVARFSISNIVQMVPEAVLSAHPRLREPGALLPFTPPEAHHAYRYQVNLAGNTNAWSRLPMIMASRSVALNLRHADAGWAYPLLRAGEHYFAVEDLDDLLRVRARCEADPAVCVRVADAANRFVEEFFRPKQSDTYAAQLLEGILANGDV